MTARLLAIVRPGQETTALDGLPALVATARAEHARLRLACFRPLPPARVDRHDRVIADIDREMDRIARSLVERFTAATRAFDDVPVECVVRFGRPAREIRLETEAFAATLVACFERRRDPSVTIRLRGVLDSWRVARRNRRWVAT